MKVCRFTLYCTEMFLAICRASLSNINVGSERQRWMAEEKCDASGAVRHHSDSKKWQPERRKSFTSPTYRLWVEAHERSECAATQGDLLDEYRRLHNRTKTYRSDISPSSGSARVKRVRDGHLRRYVRPVVLVITH